MDRRDVLLGALSAVAVGASPSWAQPTRRVPRVGFLAWGSCPGPDSVFGGALRDAGYTWGQTIQVVCRSADQSHERLAQAAAELASEKLDAIAALTHVTAYAAHRAATATPIVMIASGDPVRTGLVASLGRPGGRVTGLTYYSTDLVAKRLQLLTEIAPGLARVGVLENPDPAHVFGLYEQDAEKAARALGLRLLRSPVSRARELDRAIETIVREKAQALLIPHRSDAQRRGAPDRRAGEPASTPRHALGAVVRRGRWPRGIRR
jgi:putative tryptophan/tyrosine transport system substrate-binding protein